MSFLKTYNNTTTNKQGDNNCIVVNAIIVELLRKGVTFCLVIFAIPLINTKADVVNILFCLLICSHSSFSVQFLAKNSRKCGTQNLTVSRNDLKYHQIVLSFKKEFHIQK